MREKNSRLKAIIKQNDSDFVKETVIWHGEFATHHSEFIVAKKLLNLRNIKRIHSEIKLNSQYAKRKQSGFQKHQVYSYLIREKDSEFIVTRETPSQFMVDSPKR